MEKNIYVGNEMRKFLIGALIFVVLLYTCGWFFVASKIRSEFGNYIESSEIDLKYKEISVSGYPFDFKIILREPVYKHAKSNDIDFTLKIDGDIYFSAGLFATKFTLTSNGPWLLKGFVGNYHFKIKADASEDTSYTLKLKSSPLSKNFISNALDAKENPMKVFNIIDYFKISGEGLNVYNHSTQSSLFNVKKYNLKLSLDNLSDDMYEVSIEDDLVNAVFGSESMTLWSSLKHANPSIQAAFSNINEKVRNYFTVLSLPERGKINHEIGLKYIGNLDSDSPKFKLDVNKFYIKDLLTNLDAKGSVQYQGKKFGPDLKVDMKINSIFSDKWYNLSNEYVRRYNSGLFSVFQLQNQGSSAFLGMLNTLLGSTSSKNNGQYVPRLQDLGEVKIEGNFDFESLSQKSFKVNISEFDLRTDQYSYYLKGVYDEKDDDQKYDFNLKIDNYLKFLDDSLEYVKQIGSNQMILMIFGGGKFEVTPKSKDEIKVFVREISNSPNSSSENISYTIKKNYGERYPAVGRYNSSEFGSKWSSFKTKVMINEVQNTIQKFIPKKSHGKVGQALEILGGLGGELFAK